MKKILFALLILLLLMTFAHAEDIHFGSAYTMTVPESVKVERVEDVVTLVDGDIRTVMQLLPQDLREEGEDQLKNLMYAYDPTVTNVTVQAVSGGFLARGVIENSFGEGRRQYVAMALTEDGLLILSAYHLKDGHQAAEEYLTELLHLLCRRGKALLPREQ